MASEGRINRRTDEAATIFSPLDEHKNLSYLELLIFLITDRLDLYYLEYKIIAQ